jgi:hypothetical protein
MISKRKIEANRRNATRSTGPLSAAGKSRAAQNARRHGFASTLVDTAPRSKRAERLALALAGAAPDAHQLYQARIIAEMEIRLALIAEARNGLLMLTNRTLCATTDLTHGWNATKSWASDLRRSDLVVTCLRDLRRLDRYEQQARARRNRAIFLISC